MVTNPTSTCRRRLKVDLEIQADRAKARSWGGGTHVPDLTFRILHRPEPPPRPLPRTRGPRPRALTDPLTAGGSRFLTFLLPSLPFPVPARALASSRPRKTPLTPRGPARTRPPVPSVVLYKPAGALSGLYWGMTWRHFTSCMSQRPISVFSEFPAITTVPGPRALTKCLLN